VLGRWEVGCFGVFSVPSHPCCVGRSGRRRRRWIIDVERKRERERERENARWGSGD